MNCWGPNRHRGHSSTLRPQSHPEYLDLAAGHRSIGHQGIQPWRSPMCRIGLQPRKNRTHGLSTSLVRTRPECNRTSSGIPYRNGLASGSSHIDVDVAETRMLLLPKRVPS